ncbi:MAG: pyruvate ferredoxin oxidoreductase [Gemmatimonadetes bacterium]|nr:pyruvate ferredoxin oxidoreductase [Gemmatimonadota bacterium]
MPTLKTLATNESNELRFRGGHSLCQGCGIPLVVRTVLNTIQTPVVVINATGCLEVATTRYPTTAWNVPWLHVAFANASAAASGVEAAYRSLVRRGALPSKQPITFVVFGGDGGTYDIGLQSLSGALERGHRFLYVCYDNQAYLNTGVRRSGATPFGTSTSTSPAGIESFGKQQNRKDLTAIVVAHHVPYVAQAAISHWQDLSEKVARATSFDGPSFLNVLTPCQLGWGHPARDSVRIARLAVGTCVWPLFEVVAGRYRLTYRPRRIPAVAEWLKEQGRFQRLFLPVNAERLAAVQRDVDREWTRLLERCRQDEGWFAEQPNGGPLGLDS